MKQHFINKDSSGYIPDLQKQHNLGGPIVYDVDMEKELFIKDCQVKALIKERDDLLKENKYLMRIINNSKTSEDFEEKIGNNIR